MIDERPYNVSVYRRFRKAGYHPSNALSAARTLYAWKELDRQDLVRIVVESEGEGYFDVWGEPEGYTDLFGRYHTPEMERAETIHQLETFGCWIVSSQWRTDENSEWQDADSIGMCAGYIRPDCPYENCYVPDLMQSAINCVNSLCPQI